MMQVSVEEAESRFNELLSQVEAGETVTLTREGKPVASITPNPGSAPDSIRQAIDKAKQLRARLSLQGLSIRELMNEGRR